MNLLLILDNIRSAHNVGAILRTCDGVGVSRLYLTGITAYPPHNRIPKTALGAEESVDWEYHTDPLTVIEYLRSGRVGELRENAKTTSITNIDLRDQEYKIVSFELNDSSTDLSSYRFQDFTALVFGHEITGISDKVLEQSDATIHIPMYGKKKSFNVSTSVGIGAYEFRRQVQN